MPRSAAGTFLPGESGNEATQFKAGGPGGPGRPKDDFRLTPALRAKLLEPAILAGKPVGGTWRDFLVERLLINAARGNSRATQEILERIDGKVKQVIGLEGTGGPPISVQDAKRELRDVLAALAAAPPDRKAKARPRKAPKPRGAPGS